VPWPVTKTVRRPISIAVAVDGLIDRQRPTQQGHRPRTRPPSLPALDHLIRSRATRLPAHRDSLTSRPRFHPLLQPIPPRLVGRSWSDSQHGHHPPRYEHQRWHSAMPQQLTARQGSRIPFAPSSAAASSALPARLLVRLAPAMKPAPSTPRHVRHAPPPSASRLDPSRVRRPLRPRQLEQSSEASLAASSLSSSAFLSCGR